MRREGVTPFFLLALCGLGFAALGLPDGVLGVAWPSMRASFGLRLAALGTLLVATTAGYVASSFASGAILARVGVGVLLSLSCLATSTSLLGYALAPAWLAVVALGALAGLGAGAIDAGINTYVATHHSARTLSLLHAFYGLGTAAGPAIMTGVLMAGAGWRRGYLLIGLAQVALAAGFAATLRTWPDTHGGPAERTASAPLARTVELRASQLGIATFFLYVGLEATAGLWMFSLFEGARGLSMAQAGSAVSTYWGALLVGRLLFALVPTARPTAWMLRACMRVLALASAALALDAGPGVGLAAAAALGLAAGPIFPALVATTPHRLAAAHARNAVGFQVAAAAAGQSLLPAAAGVLADSFGLTTIPAVLLSLSVLLAVSHRLLERWAPAADPRAARAPEGIALPGV
jgi:fucose permease